MDENKNIYKDAKISQITKNILNMKMKTSKI